MKDSTEPTPWESVFSPRTSEVLKNAGIKTWDDLQGKRAINLELLPGSGATVVMEILQVLAEERRGGLKR